MALNPDACGLFQQIDCEQPRDEKYCEQHQEYEEQNLGNLRGAHGNASEAKQPGDDGYQEENQRLFQHVHAP